MTTYLPVRGISDPTYINRFFEPSLAFVARWNYWSTYDVLVAAEISATSLVVDYRDNPVIPTAASIPIIHVTIVLFNIFVVSLYGESESWFASINVISILGVIIVRVVLFFGDGPSHDRLELRYWRHPGAFKSYSKHGLGNVGKFLAFWTSVIRSGFAFALGPELITIAAGESEAPRRNIAEASKRFIYQFMVFYILGTLLVFVIVSSDGPALLQAVKNSSKDARASLFVLGIKRAGIKGLDHVIKCVTLTSAWSAANSFLYAGSCSLYSLALSGQAPESFRTCNHNGVPYVAVYAQLQSDTWLT